MHKYGKPRKFFKKIMAMLRKLELLSATYSNSNFKTTKNDIKMTSEQIDHFLVDSTSIVVVSSVLAKQKK